jgi:glutaredoxin
MYTIITRDQCNFCDDAKALLRSRGFPYMEYNIQSASSKWVLTLLKRSSITTVPQVFNPKGELIGGYTELKVLLQGDER